jgi:hypothetical protein
MRVRQAVQQHERSTFTDFLVEDLDAHHGRPELRTAQML